MIHSHDAEPPEVMENAASVDVRKDQEPTSTTVARPKLRVKLEPSVLLALETVHWVLAGRRKVPPAFDEAVNPSSRRT